jgi:protein-tyrosine-phosphatase
MAEGFANLYGSDVLRASSAGLSPVDKVALATVATMQEKNVDISAHVPRPYDPAIVSRYDLVVNMSGFKLPGAPPKLLQDWVITDPFRSSPAVYRAVRDELERRVMQLILHLRRKPKA